VMICYADHPTLLYSQKLALTSPTSGSRLVGIVRSQTEATEFLVILSVQHSFVRLSELVKMKLCFGLIKQHALKTWGFGDLVPHIGIRWR
jgi:hypothetical protein